MPGKGSHLPEQNEKDIASLVQGLDNLCRNLQVQADLLALGERALPALTEYLHGPPSNFFSGRVLAVEALGRIGGEAAFQGLLNVIAIHRLEGLDPVLRLSEEAVQNAAARELGRLGDRRALPRLLEAFRQHRLLGAAEALVRFQEPDALPLLVEGLEDAFKRDRLADAILAMGSLAIPSLLATLERRRRREGEELLPSLERRAEALRLLGMMGAREAVPAVRTALGDDSDVVRTQAALALVSLEPSDGALEAVPALLAGLTHPDFLQRDRCAEALMRVGPRGLPVIERSLIDGNVLVGREVVPLTVNARTAALAIVERLKGHVSC
jgi:HEAT repeat protein